MFDTHAHYDDSRFDEDRDALLASLFGEKGVTHILNCGCDIPTSLRSISFAEKYFFAFIASENNMVDRKSRFNSCLPGHFVHLPFNARKVKNRPHLEKSGTPGGPGVPLSF